MVAHRIEVDGEQIRVVKDSTVIHNAKITTVAKMLYGTEIRPNFELLPTGVRWMSSDRRTIMLEREPGMRLVSLTMPGVFQRVPMPYQVMLISFAEDFRSIDGLLVGLAAKAERGVASIYDDMRPFYGITSFEMPPPTTLPFGEGGNAIGEVLGVIFAHCDMQMYKLWAHEDVKHLDPSTLPDAAPEPKSKEGYEHAEFVEWWSQQTVEDAVEWTFAAEVIQPLQEFISEIDPTTVEETTLDFFKRVVSASQAIDEEEERLRQEELARQEAERLAKIEAARPRKKIVLPARYLEGFDEMVKNFDAETTPEPEPAVAVSVNAPPPAAPTPVGGYIVTDSSNTYYDSSSAFTDNF
jgi:hypothetical protein